jgi:hypothetical protein
MYYEMICIYICIHNVMFTLKLLIISRHPFGREIKSRSAGTSSPASMFYLRKAMGGRELHACMRVAVACLFFPHRRPWSSTARACQIGRTRTWSRIGTRSRARIAFASAAGIAEWFRCTAWSLSFHFTSLQRMWCEWSGGDAWCHSAILVHVFARASLGR